MRNVGEITIDGATCVHETVNVPAAMAESAHCERNARARRAYEKRGFAATGTTLPYVLDPTASEIEMSKRVT